MSQSQAPLNSKYIPSCQSLNQAPAPHIPFSELKCKKMQECIFLTDTCIVIIKSSGVRKLLPNSKLPDQRELTAVWNKRHKDKSPNEHTAHDPRQVVGIAGGAVQVVARLHPHAELAGVGEAREDGPAPPQVRHHVRVAGGAHVRARHEPRGVGHAAHADALLAGEGHAQQGAPLLPVDFRQRAGRVQQAVHASRLLSKGKEMRLRIDCESLIDDATKWRRMSRFVFLIQSEGTQNERFCLFCTFCLFAQ